MPLLSPTSLPTLKPWGFVFCWIFVFYDSLLHWSFWADHEWEFVTETWHITTEYTPKENIFLFSATSTVNYTEIAYVETQGGAVALFALHLSTTGPVLCRQSQMLWVKNAIAMSCPEVNILYLSLFLHSFSSIFCNECPLSLGIGEIDVLFMAWHSTVIYSQFFGQFKSLQSLLTLKMKLLWPKLTVVLVYGHKHSYLKSQFDRVWCTFLKTTAVTSPLKLISFQTSTLNYFYANKMDVKPSKKKYLVTSVKNLPLYINELFLPRQLELLHTGPTDD